MRVSNGREGGGDGPSGAFAELFRLQSEFQARLAEETLRYLRRLQGVVMPAAPGTFVQPADGAELRAAGAPGARAALTVEVENLQRVHCMLTPQLTPLVSAEGVTWFPIAEPGGGSRLVAPGTVERVELEVAIPAELPPGEYRGALVLQGFRNGSLPVRVSVAASTPEPKPKSTPEPKPKSTPAEAEAAARDADAARPGRGPEGAEGGERNDERVGDGPAGRRGEQARDDGRDDERATCGRACGRAWREVGRAPREGLVTAPRGEAERARLLDAPDESGRTTATLVASLAARLATLYAVSGAAAVGSLVAGFAALGREASRTAEGARLRRALERGRVAHNGTALWNTLRIRQWASLVPPAPVLDHLRNDLALLLAPNLDETLSLLPIPGEPAGVSSTDEDPPSEFLDCLVGMWAYSRDLVVAVEALAAAARDEDDVVQVPPAPPASPGGSILR